MGPEPAGQLEVLKEVLMKSDDVTIIITNNNTIIIIIIINNNNKPQLQLVQGQLHG